MIMPWFINTSSYFDSTTLQAFIWSIQINDSLFVSLKYPFDYDKSIYSIMSFDIITNLNNLEIFY